MSKDDSGPAFPNFVERGQWNEERKMYVPQMMAVSGMTRRQWLAGLAMQGIIASGHTFDPHTNKDVTVRAYQLADAMLAYEKAEKEQQ